MPDSPDETSTAEVAEKKYSVFKYQSAKHSMARQTLSIFSQ
jgi:hypothetical protein